MRELSRKTKFEVCSYEADLCVIGGGIAGMCAAVSASRRGCKVVLMQDRPVLGAMLPVKFGCGSGVQMVRI